MHHILTYAHYMMYIEIRGDSMPDYQEMYFTMARATEKAIRILIEAQRQAEEIYLSEPATDIRVLDFKEDTDSAPE